MSKSLKLLACQISVPSVADAVWRSLHVNRVVDLIDRSLQREHADLVVLPELATIDYSRAAFGNLSELAEQSHGPSSEAFAAVARKHKTSVLFGMPRAQDGKYFISQVAVGPEGQSLGHFDKLHICHYGASMEKDYFMAGEHLFVFEVAGVKVAPIICYDIRFPELSRRLCLGEGVDLICHCGAYYRDESFPSWHSFVTTRALENQAYFLSLNRAGENFGASMFCPPWVDSKTKATVFPDEECLKYFTLTEDALVSAREAYSFRKDRLPDYSELVAVE